MTADDPHIGTLNEGSLHASLKAAYAQTGDQFEVPLGGFVIDIRRGDVLIEIQTGSFAALGNKLDHLLGSHRVLLVHPIAAEAHLRRPGRPTRRSPKRRTIHHLFEELVSIPTLLDHPNLTLDVVLVSVTKVQAPDPRARRGRGGWRTVDRELREILGCHRFERPDDLLELVPTVPPVFTTADLAAAATISRDIAQQMAFCLRHLGLFEEGPRTPRGIEYRIA